MPFWVYPIIALVGGLAWVFLLKLTKTYAGEAVRVKFDAERADYQRQMDEKLATHTGKLQHEFDKQLEAYKTKLVREARMTDLATSREFDTLNEVLARLHKANGLIAYMIAATWKTVVDPSLLPDDKLEEWLADRHYTEAEKQNIRDNPTLKNAERIQFKYEYEEAFQAKTAYTNYIIENQHIIGPELFADMQKVAGVLNVAMSRAKDRYFEKNIAVNYEQFEEMQKTVKDIIEKVGKRLMFIR